jgi:hypothetical protein
MSAMRQLQQKSRKRSSLYAEWTTHRGTDDDLSQEVTKEGRPTVDTIDETHIELNDSLLSTSSSSSHDSWTSSVAAENISHDEARWLKWLSRRTANSAKWKSKIGHIQQYSPDTQVVSALINYNPSQWIRWIRRSQDVKVVKE